MHYTCCCNYGFRNIIGQFKFAITKKYNLFKILAQKGKIDKQMTNILYYK